MYVRIVDDFWEGKGRMEWETNLTEILIVTVTFYFLRSDIKHF